MIDRRYDAMKRATDVVISSMGLVLSSPLLAAVAVVVWCDLGRPVVFRQARPGFRGEPFMILKFRTMRDAAGSDGRPMEDAARLTRVGRFLRSTSLDELPELWNVLRGDMSLVGPRPLLMRYLDRYTAEQARRHEVRPGITGWAQINGRNALSWEQKFALDVWYVDHRSFRLDNRILVKTVRKVLAGDGINHPGSATAEEFTGTIARGV